MPLNFVNDNKMKDRKPWSFCETPEEKCTMNYCDENGCQNRKRNYVQGNNLIADVVLSEERTELLKIGCINSLGCACKEVNGYPLTDCNYWQGN